MSRRRRRDDTKENDVHSENESQGEGPGKLSDYTESDIEDEDLDASEYESVDEEEHHSSGEEGDPVQPEEQSTEANKVETKEEPNTEDQLAVDADDEEPVAETERESGDGKEQSDNEQHRVEGTEGKEDKAEQEEDPAFIPTKGAFFQHDVRSDGQPKGRGRDRKIWEKEPVKWSHDMFIMEEQMPKSRDILISEYGYDIRSMAIDAAPPGDARRSRGRGRGRGRGGYRGRRGRPAVPRDDRQFQEYNNNTDDYQYDYPSLADKNVKHKSKSYWKSDYKKQHQDKFQGAARERNDSHQEAQDTQSGNKENTSKASDASTVAPKAPSTEESNNEKFSDLLDVINSHEKGKSTSQSPSQQPNSRSNEKHAKNHMPLSYSNYQEPPKPRRYSSLRQRSTNSPVDKQMGQYPQRNQEPRYSNFAKPVQPTRTTTFENKNFTGSGNRSVQSQVIHEETHQTSVHPAEHTTVVSQPIPVSIPPTATHQPQPMAFADPATQANLGAPLDPGLMQMPPMAFPYNQMLNPMYFDPAAYQRMMQMMSRMGIDQMQQPPPNLPHQLDNANSAIPPDAQSLPHPAHMQMNPLLPPVSQGSLGSIMRPPPPPLNPPTYFTGPMSMPQQPFSFPPNLMAQQVGGVTYFNTPQSPPTLPPALNQQDSPRRNAAIPIMAPMGFAPTLE